MIQKFCVAVFVAILVCVSRGDISVESHDEATNEFFDEVFADLRQAIVNRQLEPVHLPADSDNFTATIFNSVLDGYIWMGDGEITGFSSLHRTGNMTISSARETQIEGHIGITDLQGKYSSELKLGPFGSNFGIEFKLSFISVDIVTGLFILPSELVLEECHIDDLSTFQITLKNSQLLTLLGNGISQIFESVITTLMEDLLCNILNDIINGAYETTPSPVFPDDAFNQLAM